MAPDFARLVDGWLDGDLSPEDAAELDARLRASPALAEGFRERVVLHGLLIGVLGDAPAGAMDKIRHEQTRRTTTSVLEAIKQRKRITAGRAASRLRSARVPHASLPARRTRAPGWIFAGTAAAALALVAGIWLATPPARAPRSGPPAASGGQPIAPAETGAQNTTPPDEETPGVYVATVQDTAGDGAHRPKLWRGGEERALQDGARVFDGDRVEVPGRARLRLDLEPGGGAATARAAKTSTLSLRGKAALTLQRARPGGACVFNLDEGTVHVRLESKAAPYGLSIQTAHVIATVTGTEFTVAATALQTRVEVKHGEVRVARRDAGAEAYVRGGEFLTAKADGPLVAAHPPKPVIVRQAVELAGLLRRERHDDREDDHARAEREAFEAEDEIDDRDPPSMSLGAEKGDEDDGRKSRRVREKDRAPEKEREREREKDEPRVTLTDAQGRKVALLRGKLKQEEFAEQVAALHGRWVRVRGKGQYRKLLVKKKTVLKLQAVEVQNMQVTDREDPAPPVEPADGPARKKPDAHR